MGIDLHGLPLLRYAGTLRQVLPAMTGLAAVLLVGCPANARAQPAGEGAPTLPFQYPPGGRVETQAGTSILVPNASGFANLATGLSVTMGCPPNGDGSPGLLTCLAGVNGGYSAYDPVTGRDTRTAQDVQRAIIAYNGGVDAVGAYVSMGPLPAPLQVAGVVVDGPRSTHLAWPPGHRPPGFLLRRGTMIRTTTLTSTLVTYITGVAADGSVSVVGWCAPYPGDALHGRVDIDPGTVGRQPGQAGLAVDVGFVTHGFGANIVGGIEPGGPQSYTAGEVDVVNNTGRPAPLEQGWTVNGLGNGAVGAGMAVNGSLVDGAPAFSDGVNIGGCAYRCLYVNMDHDGTPGHHAVAGVYLQARYNIPIVLYNDSGQFTADHGNVFTVDSGGSVRTQGTVTSIAQGPSQVGFVAAPTGKDPVGYQARMGNGVFLEFYNTASRSNVLQVGPSGTVVSLGGFAARQAPSTLSSGAFADPEPGVSRDLKLGTTGLATPLVHLSGVAVAEVAAIPCSPGDVVFAADARNPGETPGEGTGSLVVCNRNRVWLANGRPVTR